MGLSNAMSGGIILFGITYTMFAFASFTDIPISINEAIFERAELENKILKTSIELTIPDPPGTDDTFDFRIENTNLEKLWDFHNFDIIITYDSGGITYTETLMYVDCPVEEGTWCINSFTDDYFEPEILNTGESVNIRVKVGNDLESGSTLLIVVSTPNGVVSTIHRIV